jgi:hypothetical protein
LKRKTPFAELIDPDPDTEAEFVTDSPECIAYAIEYISYRDKLDKSFQTAIVRARCGLNSYEKHN